MPRRAAAGAGACSAALRLPGGSERVAAAPTQVAVAAVRELLVVTAVRPRASPRPAPLAGHQQELRAPTGQSSSAVTAAPVAVAARMVLSEQRCPLPR